LIRRLPDSRPDPRQLPGAKSAQGPGQVRERVGFMSTHTKGRDWRLNLFNWLAVVVLLSLGFFV
jgi:hypothetical protein